MNRLGRLLPWAALALMAALLAWRSRSGEETLRYYAPDAYVTRADAFIRSGALKADCSANRIQLVTHLQQASPAERSWYENSYLAEDVTRFNGDPEGYGWAFVIDQDCGLRAVNPAFHRIALPFANPILWLGSLYYRGGPTQAKLRSADREITLRHPEVPVPAEKQGTTAVGAGEDLAGKEAVLLHFAGGTGQPAARLFPIGRETVVENRVRSGEPESVRLLGHALPRGRRARFETGDWLFLEAERPRPVSETFIYVGTSAFTPASRMRLLNERRVRKTEDPDLGLSAARREDGALPVLEQMARSLDDALSVLPAERGRTLAGNFDAQLTLDPAVQLQLSQAFRRAVATVQGRHPDKPFGAGMTVLDGKTGDVLALATYPLAADLERLPVDDERERLRLLTNQNLRLHPIGSAGKPFFFAAVAHAFPFLAGLEIDPYPATPKQREILHCEIPKGYLVPAGHGAPVDFRTALQISSNRYTVELATLALAAQPGAAGSLRDLLPPAQGVAWPRPGRTSGMRIGGQPLDYAPDLGGFVLPDGRTPDDPAGGAARRCVTLDRLDQAAFREVLGSLSGASTYWGLAPQNLPDGTSRDRLDQAYTTGRYDLRPFRPLLDHLAADDDERWKLRVATQAMAPERVNLGFNQITRVREDWVSLLLGGGNSSWTNLQLAEALSRLVTGREVEARLVSRILARKDGETVIPAAEPKRRPAPELPLRPQARQLVLEGLALVSRPGGTAAPMGRALAQVAGSFPNDRLDLYSKTGSPFLEWSVPRQVPQALERLARNSRLRINGRDLAVRTDVGDIPYALPEQPGRAAFRAALAQALREVKLRSAATPRMVSHLASVLDDFAEDLKEGAADSDETPIAARNGVIRLNREHSFFRQRLAKGKGAVYVFSLVRRPAGAGDIPTPAELASPQTRVLTVAIFLAVGPNSEVAVEVATKVMPEIAALLADKT